MSVKDFDVPLHVVFASEEAKAKYLKSPRHEQFVGDNRSQFEKVQVFDSYLVKERPLVTDREGSAAGLGAELAATEVARPRR